MPTAVEIGGLGLIVGLLAIAQRLGGWEHKPLARVLGITCAVLFAGWLFLFLPKWIASTLTALVFIVVAFFAVTWIRQGKELGQTAKPHIDNSGLAPILMIQGTGNISLGVGAADSPFGVGSRLTAYVLGIQNAQMDAQRIARNVRARLEYQHAEDRFVREQATWIIKGDQLHLGRPDSTDLGPGEMQRLTLAVSCYVGNGRYETFVVGTENGELVPKQLLRFGRWHVRGSITSDNSNPIHVTGTFNIDEKGDLVALRSPGEGMDV
jgi:hypothetical protein